MKPVQFTIVALLCVAAAAQAAAATQEAGPIASTVSAIATTETDAFIDATLIGRDESDLKDRWIRFITAAHPEGFVTRVKTFDPSTGTVTLHDALPAGAVRQNDAYQLGATPAAVGAGGTSRFLMASSDPGCAPAGTSGADVIICTGSDTTGVVSEAGHDAVVVASGAAVDADRNDASLGRITTTATAVDTGDDSDSVLNGGGIAAGAVAVLSPVVAPPTPPVPGASVLWNAAFQVSTDSDGIDTGSGDDEITSTGTATSSSTAVLLPSGAPVNVPGLTSSVDVSSTARAQSTTIQGGAGDDSITSSGNVSSSATASGTGVALSFAGSSEKGSESAVGGGVTAKAHATGIAADMQAAEPWLDPSVTFEEAFEVDEQTRAATRGFVATLRPSPARPSGNDRVTNDSAVVVTASAETLAVGAGITVDGTSSAELESTAEATAAAIDLGGGQDVLTNTGQLTAAADASAQALQASITSRDKSERTTERTSAADGSVEAQARAAGISADSSAADTAYSLTAKHTVNRPLTEEEAALVDDDVADPKASDRSLTVQQATIHASGNDTVTNHGLIDATATAASGAAGVGIAIDAAAKAKVTSKAEADAAGIDLGGGLDTLTNTGKVGATADANAGALTVAVGVSNDSATKLVSASGAEAGATAEANATGLAGDSTAGDRTRAVELGITDFGDCDNCLRLTFDYADTQTRAAGDDTITNSGAVDARAASAANAGGVGVTIKGGASANTKSTSEATASAVDLGGGADTLTNTGALTGVADSTASAVAVSFTTKGKATASDGFWKGGIKTESVASGIDADGRGDETTEVEVHVWDALNVRYEKTSDTTVANGSDLITNHGNIVAQAIARSLAANVGVTGEGTAAAVSHSEGKAEATGIRAGQGHDTVNNLGAGSMTVTSDAQATAVSAAVSGKGVAVAADALWDTGTRAEASAVGIDGDGASAESTLITAEVHPDTIQSTLVYQTSTSTVAAAEEDAGAAEGAGEAPAAAVGSGNDVIVNEHAIGVNASAAATSIGVSLEAKKGLAATVSAVATEAESAGIRGGGGDDNITNRGALTSTADATADGVSIAIAVEGVAAATNSVWDGGTTAEAEAVGIDGDGGDGRTVKNTTLGVDGAAARIDHTKTEEAASGNDTIWNSAAVTASATASTVQAAVAATTKGLSAAVSQSTAKTEAAAIRGGDGTDTITNFGHLTSDATSVAVAANVALAFQTGGAIAGNAVWDGGVTADAKAVGIHGDGGNRTSVSTTTIRTNHDDVIDRSTTEEAARGDDVITNMNRIDATARATAPAVSVGFSTQGVAGAVSTATATSDAAGIDGGDGNDQISNFADVNAGATSVAVAVNGSVTNSGVAAAGNNSWDGGVKAEARTRGIDGGVGHDTLTNTGAVTAESSATSPAVTVAVAVSGVPLAVSTASAEADATAIHGGNGEEADTILNLGGGRLIADAIARGFAANVSVSNSGLAIAADAVWDGGTKADATATGIDGWLGDDNVTNSAAIDATADASVTSLAISAVVSGVAGATSTATATTEATAIDAGAAPGVDVVTNAGALKATSTAHAESAAISLAASGLAVAAGAVWDGGTTAESSARGIASEAAATVSNAGTIEALSTATAGAGAVSGTASGVAAAIATSTANATSAAIDTGTSNSVDRITNNGKLLADSTAQAGTLTIGFTGSGISAAGDAAWNGGTRAEATSRAIHAGGGADTIENDGEVDARSDALTISANVSVALSGLAGGIGTSTSIAESTAIDAGGEDDSIRNVSAGVEERTGRLTSTADAVATAAAVTVTLAGAAVSADAVWDGGTTAEATARGIDAGTGADRVKNESAIQATSHATTVSIAGALAVEGVAGAIANATGRSQAAAIDAGDADDRIRNTGTLEATATTHAVSTALGFSKFGVSAATNSFWDGGTTGEAIARGLFGGLGADTIRNAGRIDVLSDAHGVSAAVAANVAGVAGAVSTATGDATSTAIDGGDGNDVIRNTEGGVLAARADATGVAVNVAVTGAGVAAAADSVWDGGTGATATARAIYGGAGQDNVRNAEAIGATANAATVSNAVTVVGIGAGGAIATSTATSNAFAIDGGDEADTIRNQGNLTATSNATATGVAVTASGIGVAGSADAFWEGGTTADATAAGILGGAGDDGVVNKAGTLTSNASATTHSVSVTVAGAGLVGAAVGSTATARATGIDGGTGADAITLDGASVSTATSTAAGVSVSATMAGAAAAGTFVDNATRAVAIAGGLAGGAGSDTITSVEGAAITMTSTATTTDTAVSVNVLGGAEADTQAVAHARAAALDGGEDDDTIENRGVITGTTTAESRGRGVTVAVVGDAGGGASGKAETLAVGADGGTEADVVRNLGEITLTSNATARGQNVDVAVAGAILSDAKGVATARTLGLSGGDGDDAILNSGTITLLPTASAFGQTVGVSVAGASAGDASAESEGFATGMDGGAGIDTIDNTGTIAGTVAATTTARSTGVVVAGATLDKSNATAAATAVGVDGGDDADAITNAGGANVGVTASATTTAGNVTVSVAGAGGGEAQTTPSATAAGLEGGAGNDTVVNDGTVNAEARATSTSNGSSTNILGSAGGSAGTNATATATGIGGSAGQDSLLNRFMVDVDATSTGTVSGSAWNLAGAASDRSSLNATSRAFGMDGGTDADLLRNEADVVVTLSANLSTTGGSSAIFGKASADTQMSAVAEGAGLAGGAGADTIENIDRIDANAAASVTSSKTSVTFAGSPSAGGLLAARSDIRGIDGGDEADTIHNAGAIDVEARSNTSLSGGARTDVIGGASSGGRGDAFARAAGVEGGAGSNAVTNAGTIDVETEAAAISSHSSSAGLFIGTASTQATGLGSAWSAGLSAGDGDNALTNAGELHVAAEGAGFGFSDASGAHITIKGNGEALAEGRAEATAVGISAGNGGNTIVNDGRNVVSAVASTLRSLTTTTNVCSEEVVDVETCHEEIPPEECTQNPDGTQTCVQPPPKQVCVVTQETRRTCEAEDETIVLDSSPTYAIANGNGLAGDGVATSRGTATAAAFGIRAGSGANTILNSSDLVATASPDASTKAFADADVTGDAFATTASSAYAAARGIAAGDGSNVIRNTGTITVLAEPTAQADSDVTAGEGVCVTILFWTFCGGEGDGVGTATATFNADAVGILAGHGNNSIVNEGTIQATAAPVVDDGFAARAGRASTKHVTTNVTSRAVGIQTGNGDNEILNAAGGVIDAVARDASACNGTCNTDLDAIGIQTGAGDDLIVNDGVITTTVAARSGAVSAGVAIDAGAGNDRVVLGAGSSTNGRVELGADHDTLVWSGTAALGGTAFGGAGTDTFALGGSVDADFDLAEIGQRFQQFDRFEKQESSTWGLLGDRRIDWTVDAGTLAVKGIVTGTVDTSAASTNAVVAVTPTGTIRRDDAVAPAVLLDGSGMLVNDGLVEATAGAAVMFDPAGANASVVNGSAGTISSGGVAILGGGGADRVENYGLVAGGAGTAIDLAGGEDELLVVARSAMTGTALGGSGFDTLFVGGSEDGSFDLADIGTRYQEFELFGKQGHATWTLLGEGAADWRVDQALLQVEGSVIGTVATGSGASGPTVNVKTSGSVRRDDGVAAVMLGGHALLTNDGRIEGTAVGGAALKASGGSNLISNAGQILSAGAGVVIDGSGNELANHGDIRTMGAGVALSGSGSRVLNAGTVQSSGSGVAAIALAGSGNTLINEGSVGAAWDGVRTEGTGNVVINRGSMNAGNIGIAMTDGAGTVLNEGAITSGGDGVRLGGHGETLINDGTISAGGQAVNMAGGGAGAHVINNGTIESTRSAAVQGGGGSDRLDNHGTLIGAGVAVDLGGGDDEMLITANSHIEGAVQGGGGVDRLRLIGPGLAATDLTPYTGFEELHKDSASTWAVTGSSDMNWMVEAGELVVQGTLTGDGIVAGGSRLSGNGAVGSFVNAGTVAPGMSIGTITVLGDYEQAPGGVLEIEGAVTGESDRVNVTGAAVLNGGTVNVLAEDRPYGIATQYTMLEAAGGISGSFAAATSNFGYLDPRLTQDPNRVFVTLVRNDVSFRDMGDTANLQNLGGALDANKMAMAHGDFKGVMDRFLFLDEDERRAALYTMSGELHAAAARSVMRTGHRFFSAAVDRQLSARAVQDEHRTFWADAFGFSGSLDGDGNGGGARYRAVGFATGADVMVGDRTRIGAGFGLSPGSATLDRSVGGTARVRSFHPALYGEHDGGRWSVAMGAGYSRHSVRTSRDVQVGAIARGAAASYRADQYMGLTRLTLDVVDTQAGSLGAFGELRYSMLRRPGFSESGAESAGLADVQRMRTESLQSVVGFRATFEPRMWGMSWRPDVRIGWAHEARDDRGRLTASLQGAPAASGYQRFGIQSAAEARDMAVLSVSTAAAFAGRGEGFLTYDGSLTGTGAEHGFVAGLRIGW